MEHESMTLRELVWREVCFFGGFEYGDTAIRIDKETQNEHKSDIRQREDGKKIAGVSIVTDGAEKSGFVVLTNRYLAERGG